MSQINTNTIANELGTGGPDFVGMPTVGGDPVVESGSNTDGEWTRWADGTQVAYMVSASANLEQIIVYPVQFNSAPISVGNKDSINNAGYVYFSNATNSQILLRVSTVGDSTRLIFIGHWK